MKLKKLNVKEKMILAIVGSRNLTDIKFFYEKMSYFAYDRQIEKIVTGDAKGADAMAQRWAKSNGIPCEVFKADWYTYGRKAGPLRNAEIMKEATHCVAFRQVDKEGKSLSKGTDDSISKAQKKGIPCEIFTFEI